VVGKAITPNVPAVQGSAPFTYSTSFAMPSGLSLNASTGVVSGTPAPSAAGSLSGGQTYYYDVIVTNSLGADTTGLEITITPPTAAVAPASTGRAIGFQAEGGARLSFAAPRGALFARVEILNARGVRVWETTQSTAGGLAWNGTGAGRPAPAGVYSLRLTWLDEERKETGMVTRLFAFLP
jgi:hypothetical protein